MTTIAFDLDSSSASTLTTMFKKVVDMPLRLSQGGIVSRTRLGLAVCRGSR
jgi:hypothetical protein